MELAQGCAVLHPILPLQHLFPHTTPFQFSTSQSSINLTEPVIRKKFPIVWRNRDEEWNL
jgi:hypothetical protein